MRMSALFLAAVAGTASADTFIWDYAGQAHNAAAGAIQSINTTYNDVTEKFTWDVTFSDGASLGTDGYTLVISPGPNPKGIEFELAMIYFDATSAVPEVSVYRYNGKNNASSYLNPADLLASTKNGDPIAAGQSDNGNARTFTLSIDAAAINAAYGPPTEPDWTGIEFGASLGIWFHPFKDLTTAYAGPELTQWSFGMGGWLDLSDVPTVPSPAGAVALLGLAGLVARRRR